MSPIWRIQVYKGEWGLPSIDFECLRALCFIKFTNAPIKIDITGNPFRTKTGQLPCLNYENLKVDGYDRIFEVLDEQGYTLRSELSKEILSLCSSYEILVHNNLHPYFMYTLFGDPRNYEDTRTLYATRTCFPYNFYYPSKYGKVTNRICEIFAGFSTSDALDDHNTDEIILKAKQCVNMLSKKLDRKLWFFGDKPSELDAQIYSYLSILYYIPLTVNSLQGHIRECPNLVAFIERITRKYFAKDGYDSRTAGLENHSGKTANGSATTVLTASEQEFLNSKTKTQIFAGVGAAFAMALYAAWIGIVHISRDDSDYSDQSGFVDYEEEDE